MRASMTADGNERCKGLGCAFGDPQGFVGGLALAAMAVKNERQNAAALALLAPRAGDSVLEIGCGPGMGLRAALKRVGKTGYVAGVDRSGLAAHIAAHTIHHAAMRGRAMATQAEAANLPFREAMFDRIYTVNSFQFWPDPARALREVARVLAPRGRLVITQRAANPNRPTDFAGAGAGMETVTQATTLLKSQGWRILDERCDRDGARLMAVSVLAERPE